MANTQRTLFRMEVSVSADIAAPPNTVWGLLTDAAGFPAWNSTIQSIDGDIAEGQTIRLVATVDPKRTFNLKIRNVRPGSAMTWSDGMAPMFKGVRTFELRATDGGTRFHMTEVLSGLMLPLIASSLPEFGPIFDQYAADLTQAAESAAAS